MPPTLPPQAEEDEDNDDDWDEVSPPQIVPVMEEDPGGSSNAAGGLDNDEFDEALFGAELEQSLMEPDGDPDTDADADREADKEEDFLMAAVLPVVKSVSFSGVPMSFHQMAGGDMAREGGNIILLNRLKYFSLWNRYIADRVSTIRATNTMYLAMDEAWLVVATAFPAGWLLQYFYQASYCYIFS
ncbi:hypothetical protein DL96DRAFT_1565689 [Flagelloscypha sp. PMI_526]|nr:hypothetical protein DL96DRAFT_1565689 [Flagelloscypha sp. PMI_526]